ncbi:MAG: hypothetical protein NDI82_01400 [Anaeromyxobacteraceae bacterium]|nr:hypothetical protein [Anaeromyxobacteraceae bacterium]
MDRLTRTVRSLAIATAALAGCAHPPPTPRPAEALAAGLAGCQAGQVDRTTWRVQCAGLVAQVHDPYGEREEDLLALGEARIALTGGGVARAEPARLPLAGAPREARRVTLAARADAKKVRAAGLAATVPFGEARTRLAWCAVSGGDPARCAALLDLLGALPWRAGPPPAGALPPELAGRPVLVPAGCEALADPRGGDLSCSSTDGWRWRRLGLRKEVSPSDLEYAENAEEARRQAPAALEPVPEPPADGTPCRVDGVATRCAVKEAWGGTMVTITTVATVREQPLELTCSFMGAPDDVPAVCDGLELGE